MDNFESHLSKIGEFGVVEEVHHPISIVSGLPNARLYEVVFAESGEIGQVFMLGRDVVEIVFFSKEAVNVGTRLTRANRFLSIPVGETLLGNIVDPLGKPISNIASFRKPNEVREIDSPPLSISERSQIKTPFLTGTSLIDLMMPLGLGQKELIIGDRKTGKTSFLLGTIKNQVDSGSVAIYCGIARRKSDIKNIQVFFEKHKILSSCIIVSSTSYDPASLIFLTPYSAMTIAEYFRDKGRNVLLILDDLTTHAKFYRELSLISKRFPGRDSYPGDIFYIHAKLLERAGNFKITNKAKMKLAKDAGEVSITVLPVAEIVEGDFTGYISTNLMGMTDGHIFFDGNIYNRGRRPAVNISLSVTRVGVRVQSAVLRDINHQFTSLLALYDKMQNLSHFGAELTDTVKYVLKTGDMIYKFFDQHYTVVVPLPVQLVLFGMLWLQFFSNPSSDFISSLRLHLLEIYKEKKIKTLFDKLIESDSFDGMLNNISREKELLLSLCNI